MTNENKHTDLKTRIQEYRVDFCYSKELFFAAAQRIRKENSRAFAVKRGLNITSIILAIITASSAAFYYSKINEEAAILVMGCLAIISLGIAIYLMIEKKQDDENEYVRRAEEYLNLYKYVKNIDAKIGSKQISDEDLAKEIDKIQVSQYMISARELHTTQADRDESWEKVQAGACQCSEDDFRLT